MALVIKKIIRDSNGNIVEEVEGTEAEIESYEKKRSKKDESAKKKKEVLLGKGVTEAIQKLIDAAILKHQLLQPHTNTVQHHWHHNNGWWWAPNYLGGWYYTQQNPNLYPGQVYCSSNSSAEVAGVVGTSEHEIIGAGSIGANGVVGYTISTTNTAVDIGGQSTGGYWSAKSVNTGELTSGIINMNIKS